MGAEVGRYLWWWVHDNKWDRRMLTVPILLIGGVLAMVTNLAHGRLIAALVSVAVILLGLLFLFLEFLTQRRNRPWNKPPWHDPEYTRPPWSPR